jgi:hypothetical protein
LLLRELSRSDNVERGGIEMNAVRLPHLHALGRDVPPCNLSWQVEFELIIAHAEYLPLPRRRQ